MAGPLPENAKEQLHQAMDTIADELRHARRARTPKQREPKPLPDIKSLAEPLPPENMLAGLQQAASALIRRAEEMASFPLTETVKDIDGNEIAIKPVRWTMADVAKNYKAAAEMYEKIAQITAQLPSDPHADRAPGPKGKRDLRHISAKERPFAALQLRLKGWTLQEIADGLGYADPTGAWFGIKSLLDQTITPPTEDLRRVEVERLDLMLKTAWSAAFGAMGQVSMKALDRCVAIEKLRVKLLGLEMPRQIDVHAVIERVAAEHGYDEHEKQQATQFVEEYLRSKRSEQQAI